MNMEGTYTIDVDVVHVAFKTMPPPTLRITESLTSQKHPTRCGSSPAFSSEIVGLIRETELAVTILIQNYLLLLSLPMNHW